jgi:ornithine carbamoyltransferase
MARYASVPVINGLTDRSHPCQIVADLLTIVEQGKALPGLEVAWLGDGNNVLHSIIEAAGLMKFNVRVGTPQGYDPIEAFVAERAPRRADHAAHAILRRPRRADIVVTDTWVSMGQAHVHNKLAAMAPFQVNEQRCFGPTRVMVGAVPRAGGGATLRMHASLF